MTDETEQATIFDADSVDVEVASDPAESKTIVTGMTISASEQVSTGDYESYEPYQSARLRFSPPIDVSDPDGRAEVRYRALQAHHDIQKDLERAIDQRLKDPSFEDWPQGIPGVADPSASEQTDDQTDA